MASEKKIAVVGATGRLGHHAVEILRERGHEVVPISRSEGVDVISGEGLGAALEGVDLIVDAASSPTPRVQPSSSRPRRAICSRPAPSGASRASSSSRSSAPITSTPATTPPR